MLKNPIWIFFGGGATAFHTVLFLALSPEQLCSDLSRQIKSLVSMN